ncbi:MAG: hypothetical protein ACXVEF_39135, partial [Polyangiales bacterium]
MSRRLPWLFLGCFSVGCAAGGEDAGGSPRDAVSITDGWVDAVDDAPGDTDATIGETTVDPDSSTTSDSATDATVDSEIDATTDSITATDSGSIVDSKIT